MFLFTTNACQLGLDSYAFFKLHHLKIGCSRISQIIRIIIVISSIFYVGNSNAQQTSSFIVGGDVDKYYPVCFDDRNWDNNRPTEFTLCRSFVHIDGDWKGSLSAVFTFHTNKWGNSSEVIQADIKSFQGYPYSYFNFIAGCADVSNSNSTTKILVWLKGGNTVKGKRFNY